MLYKKKEYTREGDQFYIDGVAVNPDGWVNISGIEIILVLYENGDTMDVFTGGTAITIPKNRFVKWVDHGYKVGDLVKIRKTIPRALSSVDSDFWFWVEMPQLGQNLGGIEKIKAIRSYGYEIQLETHKESFLMIDRKLTKRETDKIEFRNLEKMLVEKLSSQTGDLEAKKQKGLRDFVLASKKIETLVAGFDLKKSIKDFMDNFEYGVEKIKKYKGVEEVEGDYSGLVIYTDHLFLDFGKPEFIGMYSGKFIIRIEILNQIVTVMPLDMPWESQRTHPHVFGHGGVCFGNMKQGVATAFAAFDVFGVFIHAFETLHGISGSTNFRIYDRNLNYKKELNDIFKKLKIEYPWKEKEWAEICDDCENNPCTCDRCSYCGYLLCECEECDCGAMPWDSCSC